MPSRSALSLIDTPNGRVDGGFARNGEVPHSQHLNRKSKQVKIRLLNVLSHLGVSQNDCGNVAAIKLSGEIKILYTREKILDLSMNLIVQCPDLSLDLPILAGQKKCLLIQGRDARHLEKGIGRHQPSRLLIQLNLLI